MRNFHLVIQETDLKFLFLKFVLMGSLSLSISCTEKISIADESGERLIAELNSDNAVELQGGSSVGTPVRNQPISVSLDMSFAQFDVGHSGLVKLCIASIEIFRLGFESRVVDLSEPHLVNLNNDRNQVLDKKLDFSVKAGVYDGLALILKNDCSSGFSIRATLADGDQAPARVTEQEVRIFFDGKFEILDIEKQIYSFALRVDSLRNRIGQSSNNSEFLLAVEESENTIEDITIY